MALTLFPDPLPFVDYQYPAKPQGSGLIALVGEAPGADEVRLNRPFVGRSGQLLDKALESVGIDRANCLVANVFRQRPPGNKVTHFFSSRRRALAEGRALSEQWGKLGAEFCFEEFTPELNALTQVLREQKPAIVVALGRVPLWALTGQNGITTLRGKPLDSRMPPLDFGSAPVIATFHPSFVSRQNSVGPETMEIFRADLAAARKIAKAGRAR